MTKFQKVLAFAVIFVLALSTIAFATEIQPRTAEPTEIQPREGAPVDNSVDTGISLINETNPSPIEETDEPEILYKDVFKFEDEIVMDDLVDGNVFLMGKQVTVTGEINGDLYVFGDEVTIADDAFVYSSLFVCANKLTLNGACYDLYAFAKDFDMGENSYIYRDMNFAGYVANLKGYVNRNANIYVSSSLELNHEDGPTVIGDLNCTSPTKLEIDESKVGGNINFTQEVKEETEEPAPKTIAQVIIGKVKEVGYLVLIFLLASLIAPMFVKRTGEYASSMKLLHALWIGFVATAVFIIADIVLLFFVPKTALVLLLLYIAALLLTAPIFVFAASTAICNKFNWNNFALKFLMNIIVSAVAILLSSIPIIGWCFGFIYYIMGLGFIILYLFDRERRGTKKEKAVKEKKQKEVTEPKEDKTQE